MFSLNQSSSPKELEVDGYESLQKRINEKNDFLEKVFNSFNELNKYLKEVFKKLLLLNSTFTNITFSFEEQNIQETFKLIYQRIISNVEQDNNLVENIIKIISGHINVFNNEKTLYNEFKRINKELQDEKEILHKNKDIYHKTGKEAENRIKKFVKNNFKNISNLSDELKKELDFITSPFIKSLNNYKNSIDKVNQLKNKYNNKQKIIFDNNLPELGNEDGVFFFRIVKLYLQNLEDGEKYLNLNKKQLNDSKTLVTNSKLKELIEDNEKNKKEEKSIDFIQYHTNLDFNKCKNKEEFDLYAKSIELINQSINNEIFPNYNYDNELKNFEEGQLIKEMFEDKELDNKKAEKFLESLKDESVHSTIYTVLSQLRTSRFQREKPLIELLGKTFEILLEFCEKNKLYEDAKNYIILSQTYFYKDENENKIYAFELIKNNKWLSKPKFWRGFIDFMIKKEFERLEKTIPETKFNEEENVNNINQKVRDEISDVVISQLLPFISNMNDFGIDKRIILKIIDEFKEKINYITPANLEALYGIVSNNKEEIEKFRKEYNPSLEPELLPSKVEDNKIKLLNENIGINENYPDKKNELIGKNMIKEDKEETKEILNKKEE